MVNSVMLPFFRLLVIKVDRGLSTFKGDLILRRISGQQWRNYVQQIKKAQDNCDSICGSDIKNGINSDSMSDSYGDSYKTNDYDVV